jgi:titin
MKLFGALVCTLTLGFSILTSAVTNPASAATPTAPTITGISRIAGGLTVTFTAPTGVSPSITNYEYSVDGGSTWVSPLTPITGSPFTISGLVDCQQYLVSVRAVNSDGAGAAATGWNGVPGSLTYHLNNSFMKFGASDWNGNGDVESIDSTGNLKQPWYKNSIGGWSKLTYSNYSLNYGLGADGDGSAEWNTNGIYGEVRSPLSQMIIDCSQFVETTRVGSLATGYGKLTVIGRATVTTNVGTKVIEVTRSYSQTATGKYTVFNETIKNIGTTTLTNARVVIGTQDDWLEQDGPTKRRGNIVDGVFTQITNSASQAKVLEITSSSDAVYFYTTSNLGYITGLNGYGDFTNNVMLQNPATAATNRVGAADGSWHDGSYGMYLRFQDIAPGASESFTWYYIASTKTAAAELLGNVASAALPGAPTVDSVTAGDSQASVDFTEGTIGGAALTNYQYSTNGGSTWQTRSPAGTTSPLIISGLANGTEYNVQLRAVNSEGVGTATTSTAVTPVGPPPAPLITGIEQAETSVNISFTQSATGGSNISNYEYSRDGGVTWITPSPAVTTSPLSITGLTRGTNYDFALRAINSVGTGVASAIQEATTLDLPDAPSIGSVTASNQSLSIPFTLGENGGTPITNVEYSLDGGASWVTRSPASTYSPLLIENLTNGQSYQAAVRSINSIGHSIASSTVSASPNTVPGAISLPLNTNVTPSNQSLTVSFSAPDNGGSAITRYEYSTDRGLTWRTRTDGGLTSTSLQITTLSSDGTTLLTNGQEYCIQLRAANTVGEGSASNDVCSTPKTVPDVPTLNSVTSRDGALDVSYTFGGNGGSPITGIEYCITTCNVSSNWVYVATTSSPFRITGLVNGTGYTVNLKTVNTVGSSSAVVATSVVTPANNPTSPTIDSVSTSSRTITVAFTIPTSNGGVAISGYEYSTDGGTTWRARTDSGGTSTSLVITKLSSDGTTLLTNGLSYAVSIRAVTASTVGLSSSNVFATPSTTPSAPTNATFSVLNARIDVDFTAGSDGGSPITNYEYALSTNDGTSWGNFTPANVLTPNFTITNLVNGTSYRVKIRATNSRGSGAELTSSSSYTPTGVPDSPIISATSNSRLNSSLTDTQIQVTFSEPANNGSQITNYQYSTDNGVSWRARTDSTGRFSPLIISKLSSDGTTDLAIDTAYQIKIRAINVNGAGDESLMTSARTGGVVDTTAPTVSITSRVGNESPSRTMTYDVVFSETIQGLDRFDFSRASGTATCSVTAVSGTFGTNFTATVTCSTDGSYRLRLNANAVTDGSNLGPVTNQDALSVTVDTLAPSATITSPSSQSGSRTLSYPVAFSSTVTGIGTGDFYQVSGTSSCATTAVSAANGSSATFTVTCSSDGTVVMGLRADSVVRSGMTGPVNTVSASSVTIDSSVPTATVSLESIDSSKTTLVYEIAFSEVVSDISLTDFVKASGSATCQSTAVTASSGSTVSFTVTCTVGGSLQMKLLADSVTDGTNLGPLSVTQTSSVTVGPVVAATPSGVSAADTLIPTASIVSPSAISRTRSLSYTVNFSESVSDISTLDFVKQEGTAECSTISVSQPTGTSVTFRVSCSTDGNVVMQLAAQSVSDGTNLGPVTSVASREVSVRTLPPAAESTQASSPQTQSTPQATSSPQTTPRAPVLLDGQLPEVRTSNPLTIVAGQMSENSSQILESGGQQMVIPTGVSVTIEGKSRSNSSTPTTSSSGLIQVANGDGLEVTASGLKPGTEVAVWLFSTPRLLGTAIVNEDGTLSAVFELGSDVPAGKHTAQVSGLNSKGDIVAFNAGVELIGDQGPLSINREISLTALLLALATSLLVAMFIVVLLLRRRNSGSTT